MKIFRILEILLTIVAAGLFLYIYRGFFLKFFSGKASEKNVETATSTVKEVEDINPNNLIGKNKLKLVSYKEALEASRQFIYDIANLVMQRFSPASKETLLELGTKLVNAGVQYIHVIDIFKISLEKQRTKTIAVKKTIQGKRV